MKNTSYLCVLCASSVAGESQKDLVAKHESKKVPKYEVGNSFLAQAQPPSRNL